MLTIESRSRPGGAETRFTTDFIRTTKQVAIMQALSSKTIHAILPKTKLKSARVVAAVEVRYSSVPVYSQTHNPKHYE